MAEMAAKSRTIKFSPTRIEFTMGMNANRGEKRFRYAAESRLVAEPTSKIICARIVIYVWRRMSQRSLAVYSSNKRKVMAGGDRSNTHCVH